MLPDSQSLFTIYLVCQIAADVNVLRGVAGPA
jgi:hypothetical protein